MYNIAVRNLINKIELRVDELKKDYEDLEELEKEQCRKNCIEDIQKLRNAVNMTMQRLKDLRWIEKNV